MRTNHIGHEITSPATPAQRDPVIVVIRGGAPEHGGSPTRSANLSWGKFVGYAMNLPYGNRREFTPTRYSTHWGACGMVALC